MEKNGSDFLSSPSISSSSVRCENIDDCYPYQSPKMVETEDCRIQTFAGDLVVASAGEDKKISLWRKNGQRIGTIPVDGSDSGDIIEESILAISFSNKGSRYICSGGSGQVVRIWDLQRKSCIKWLRGHTSSIAGVMYNCKDEHLASISLSGDLILHNLVSGAKAAELKDPDAQELKVLDYSRISRHILVTAGDDGSVHLWDTTGRSPKVSWLNQHSAPTAGISFSPSNDKIIASVGLDKKLHTYDSGSRRPSAFISYEAPFSSLAFRDDGWTLAAGTGNGRVVFYDIRGKLQPFTVLRAYSIVQRCNGGFSSYARPASICDIIKPYIVYSSLCFDLQVVNQPVIEGGTLQTHKAPQQDPQQGSNFTLQLFQRTLEETLDSFQKSIHGDMRNLHIEILRQFHMQETEMSRVMSSIRQNQAELMEEVKSLRKENQQLRQLL
ncbi:Transducin/WD40 repeat-like superfamily protein isoform 2 [Hibiscus syriacus]|uniref:Transducin/WD40 repeat-like superfamily protein isoform 2 n=1 Tax=Hibiscus syriacus TaxID=106335 RepID=A0A6A2XHA8_HIBSY|nr:Transducin/WD40 repeat-like superfamily protein isoform 2 [Hibiscus syriacus]